MSLQVVGYQKKVLLSGSREPRLPRDAGNSGAPSGQTKAVEKSRRVPRV